MNTPVEIPYFFNWPLEFPRSSIHLEIPCLLHPCHLFGLDFFWNSPALLLFIHIKLSSHLKQATTVLFSSSRAGSHVFKIANIGMLTFSLLFSRQELTKNLPKMKDFNVLWLKLYWSKTHEIKGKFKFNLYLTFKVINIHNRSCRELFFAPILNSPFHCKTYWRISNSPAQARKQYARNKTRFSFKIKDWIILFELEGILKNN